MVNKQQVSQTHLSLNGFSSQGENSFHDTNEFSTIFNLNTIQRQISSMSTIIEKTLTRDDTIIPGTTNTSLPLTF